MKHLTLSQLSEYPDAERQFQRYEKDVMGAHSDFTHVLLSKGNKIHEPFKFHDGGKISRCLFSHNIRGSGGSLSFEDLISVLTSGFDSWHGCSEGDSPKNSFLIVEDDFLSSQGKDYSWGYGDKDFKLGDIYGIVASSAEITPWKDNFASSYDSDRAIIRRVAPEYISHVCIKLGEGACVNAKKSFYREELFSFGVEIFFA